jgi:hypothetical protein
MVVQGLDYLLCDEWNCLGSGGVKTTLISIRMIMSAVYEERNSQAFDNGT